MDKEANRRAKTLLLVLGLCFGMLISAVLSVGANPIVVNPELQSILHVAGLACAFICGVIVGREMEML